MKEVEQELAVLRRVLGPGATLKVDSNSGAFANGAGTLTHFVNSTIVVAELGLVLFVESEFDEGSDSTRRTLRAPATVEPGPLLDALNEAGLSTSLDRNDPRAPKAGKR